MKQFLNTEIVVAKKQLLQRHITVIFSWSSDYVNLFLRGLYDLRILRWGGGTNVLRFNFYTKSNGKNKFWMRIGVHQKKQSEVERIEHLLLKR